VSVLLLIQGPPEVASSRTRAFAYLPFLAEAGVPTEVHVWHSQAFVAAQVGGTVPLARHVANLLHHVRVALRVLRAAGRHRTVYVQKVVLPVWFLRMLKRGRRRLVFDYDDALYALSSDRDHGPRAIVRRRRMRRFTDCLAAADLVVLENEPNRAVTEKFCPRTLVITGPIDTNRYRPRPRPSRDEVILGWVGSPSTTAYLRIVESAIRRVAERRRVALHLVGAAPVAMPGLAVRQSPWALETELDHLATFDIGLMPLTDDAWSRGKGGYKILQYMAMGIPTVASPVGINSTLIRPGDTGLLASHETAWVEALDQLIRDPISRRRMGAAARDDVVRRFSLTHYAPIFVQALMPDASAASAHGGIGS
jgi:glycosyltransferase involved in cell wall biosynthesis